MSGVDVSADGVARLVDTLDQAAAALLDLDQVNEEAADDVLGIVRPPVRTGRLASTVRAEADALGFTLTAGGPGAPYAPYVHKRKPFLTEALEKKRQEVVDEHVGHVRDAVNNIKGD